MNKDHNRGCPCCQYTNMVQLKNPEESRTTTTHSPLKGTSTIGARGGVSPKKFWMMAPGQQCVTEVKLRGQVIHLDFKEKLSVEDSFEANERNQNSRPGSAPIQGMDA